MKVTVCELPDGGAAFESAWQALGEHVRARVSDLVLLPELPACPWLADLPDFDATRWRDALLLHAALLQRLPELGTAIVLGTRPSETEQRRLNQGFAWTPKRGTVPVHESTTYRTRTAGTRGAGFTAAAGASRRRPSMTSGSAS